MKSAALEGKVALVTGGGRGIGAAVASAYARAGAAVACAARSVDELDRTVSAIKSAGGEAVAVQADVTDHAAVKSMCRIAADAFGGIDIVVVNAGGNLDRSRLDQGEAEAWVATIELNLIGAYYCIREAIPYLKQRGAGKIITIGSGMGHRGAPGGSSYAAAKAGLWMLTRVAAQELAENDISVNELIPGPVRTELTRDIERIAATSGNPTPFLAEQEWIKTPEDVVELALFLASQPDHGPTAQSYSLMRRDG